MKVSVEVHDQNDDDPIYHTICTIRPEAGQEAGQSSQGAGPNVQAAGPSFQGAGPSSQEAGPSSQEAGPSSQEMGQISKEPIREWEEESGPPTLPPPRIQNMSRAEEYVYLFTS